MKKYALGIIATLLVTANAAVAAENSNERQQTRRVQMQLKAVQKEKAALTDQVAENEKKLTEQTQQIAGLRSKAAAANRKMGEQISALEQQLAESNKQLAEMSSKFQETDKKLQQVTRLQAETKQALQQSQQQNKQLNADVSHQLDERKICEQKNTKLYQLSAELMEKYKSKTAMDAMRQAEPFTQLERVRVENLLQEYRDRADAEYITAQERAVSTHPSFAGADDTAPKKNEIEALRQQEHRDRVDAENVSAQEPAASTPHPSFAGADDSAPKKKEIGALRQQEYSVKMISPIFGQLVMLSFPKGFMMVSEDTKGAQYIRESVLTGESTKKWSQMVTITGAKGLASNPNVTPQVFANRMAGGFKNACPTSFNRTGLGTFKVNGYDAFADVISCGVANPTGDLYSESVLLIVIKGESDYYTIQWAERSNASTAPIDFDEAKWTERFKRLEPIKLCSIVPGEPAPYPSCVGDGYDLVLRH